MRAWSKWHLCPWWLGCREGIRNCRPRYSRRGVVIFFAAFCIGLGCADTARTFPISYLIYKSDRMKPFENYISVIDAPKDNWRIHLRKDFVIVFNRFVGFRSHPFCYKTNIVNIYRWDVFGNRTVKETKMNFDQLPRSFPVIIYLYFEDIWFWSHSTVDSDVCTRSVEDSGICANRGENIRLLYCREGFGNTAGSATSKTHACKLSRHYFCLTAVDDNLSYNGAKLKKTDKYEQRIGDAHAFLTLGGSMVGFWITFWGIAGRWRRRGARIAIACLGVCCFTASLLLIVIGV